MVDGVLQTMKTVEGAAVPSSLARKLRCLATLHPVIDLT